MKPVIIWKENNMMTLSCCAGQSIVVCAKHHIHPHESQCASKEHLLQVLTMDFITKQLHGSIHILVTNMNLYIYA